MGRPTMRTPELEAEILRRIAEGRSMHAIEAEEGMPSRETMRRWCGADPEFRSAIEQARARWERNPTRPIRRPWDGTRWATRRPLSEYRARVATTHGSRQMYGRHGCRCGECVHAQRERSKARYAAERGEDYVPRPLGSFDRFLALLGRGEWDAEYVDAVSATRPDPELVDLFFR